MLRIVALNEVDKEEQSDEEIVATKEAQETIAEYEYVRAVKLKFQQKPKLALSLLLELLKTEVLNLITEDESNRKLWAIRYNCHKNIATISEEMGNFGMALENYVMAMQLDSSDVHTIHRFGRFVLRRNALELAQCAFENCLRKNPAHWSAAEGLLKTLCGSQNILGAYGWALKLYRKNPNYKAAASLLSYIFQRFNNVLPFFELLWGSFPEDLKHVDENANNKLFLPKKGNKVQMESPEEISLKPFAVTNMNFTSVAHYILGVFEYLKEKGSLYHPLSVDEMVASEEQSSTIPQLCSSVVKMLDAATNSNETPEGTCEVEGESISLESPLSKGEVQFVEATNIESANDEGNSKGDSSEASKSKPRRRCSDLHFLEQWGWHKTRRYASRRKGQERPETDTSLRGYLRRMFAKYTSEEFKDEWPFLSNSEKSSGNAEIDECYKCSGCETNGGSLNLEQASEKLFDTFIKGLKAKPFDIVLLIFKWLKCVSSLWQFRLPEELKSLYLKIYTLYIDLYDFSTWNQMSCENFEDSTNVCLLYLELEYSKMSESNDENKSIPPMWSTTFDHLMYTSGMACIALQDVTPFKMRLLYIKYLCCSLSNRLEDSVVCLKDIELLMANEGQSTCPALHVPNLTEECLTEASIRNMRLNIQRELELNKIVGLFENQNWKQLVHIIRDSIFYCKEEPNCENWLKDFKVQMELLLQSLWKTGSYEECLIWGEKYLHYATYNFLKEIKGSYRRILWEESINFALSYIDALTTNEGYDILNHLEERLHRLVQNCIRILTNYLDPNFDKNANTPPINFKRLWVILHQLMLREENSKGVFVKPPDSDNEKDEEDLIPNSYLILFTAHEFMGKHQWCTKDNGAFLSYILDVVAVNLRAPLYDSCRDILYEYIEQVTFCLYGYPQKKARSRHLEDHEASPIELSWSKAIQLFDLYRPDNLPEFNSYKLESISSDMEQLLLRIVSLMPNELDAGTSAYIVDFIKGEVSALNETACSTLPFKINSIFYLLADYYFKNRDFLKTTKYYKLDLACNPMRFDSWAGMALSKASKVESKINMFDHIAITNLLSEGDEVIRCFERCIELDRNQTLLWIEYGSFTYIMHSHCSRHLKHNSENLSMEEFSFIEERKDRMLNIAFNCFGMAANLQSSIAENPEDHDNSIEDKWLSQYMLGKISEKRKENPSIYLNYYLKAANYLYESNATYPIKINHNNPTTLSVEALEVFYRTNSAIMKYLEHESSISREIGHFFKRVLSILAKSPFAFNKAKIDGNSLNALKRKVVDKSETDTASPKILKESKDQTATSPFTAATKTPSAEKDNAQKEKDKDSNLNMNPEKMVAIIQSPHRRQSQESGRTGTTTTVTSSATSSSSSSDTTSSESDTDTEGVNNKNSNIPFTTEEIQHLLKTVVGNLEECITRFPEHFKSIFRLVFHYMNRPAGQAQDLSRCEQLLLGQYRTGLGNQINGLFFERKTNNLFNGIWRIPSSEIDRPGSFSAHLTKCISILIQILMKSNNYNLLIDIGLQLFKTPDHDKRYIKDDERIELYRQCITYSAQVLRQMLKNMSEKRDDRELIDLLINIYKIHKKCTKHFSHKEPLITQLLVDVYKFYISNKVEHLPDNFNYLDFAIKLCVQQLSAIKTVEKSYSPGGYRTYPTSLPQMASPTFANLNMPTAKPRIQNTVRSTATATSAAPKNLTSDGKFYPTFTPSLFADLKTSTDIQTAQIIRAMQADPNEFQRIYAEYYKQACEKKDTLGATNAMPMLSTSYSLNTQKPVPSISSSLPSETTITPSNLLHSAANLTEPKVSSGPDANKMGYDITITPCSSKQSPHSTQYQENTTITQQDSVTTTTTTTTTYKEKTVSKTKTNFTKPYSRGVATNIPNTLPGLGADMATISLMQTQQQTQLLNTYADLLKNKALPQIQISPKTSSFMGGANQRDLNFSTDRSSTSTIQKSSTSMTISSTGIQAPFNMPKFDSNVISVSTSSSNGSPTKTLQQKLIERQKANQSATEKAKSDVDVIILD